MEVLQLSFQILPEESGKPISQYSEFLIFKLFCIFYYDKQITNNNYTIVNLNSSKFICNSKNYFPPIKSINKLKFKFRYHDGLLVDFNILPVSFTIEIGTLQEEQRRLANIRFQN